MHNRIRFGIGERDRRLGNRPYDSLNKSSRHTPYAVTHTTRTAYCIANTQLFMMGSPP